MRRRVGFEAMAACAGSAVRSAAAAAAILASVLCAASTALAVPPPDDQFIAGYVAAILEREFDLPGAVVKVEDGVVTVEAASLAGHSPGEIEAALATVRDVRRVIVREPAEEEPAAPPTSAAAAPAAAAAVSTAAASRNGPEVLPPSTLFEPLRADPRWPHFSAAFQYFEGDEDAENVGAVSFGETLSLLRGEGLGGQIELDFQAGVFSIFDLGSESEDLINADYMVGVPLVYRRGSFSSLLRVYHQSSHLGDEFILRSDANAENRVNLSYEAVDLLLSYDIGERWRVYGGGGYLFDQDPGGLDPGKAQAGFEYESDALYWGLLRPVAGFDLQFWEERDWDPDLSLRAGFQIGDPGRFGQQLEITAEYYNGRNPNGQFFLTRDLEYYGLGLHLYFN